MKKALLFFLLFPFIALGQDNLKHIKNPENKKSKKCRKYYEINRKLPIDIRYSVKIIDQRIIFYFPSEEVFRQIFEKKFDGIAIDIVDRDQYSCTKPNELANSWAFKGELLPPIFKKKLEDRMIVDQHKNVTVDFGLLPPKYAPLHVECNMIVLQKKFLCDYRTFSNIDYNQWELLEMGLYRDSWQSLEDQEFLISKELTFEIPFEKNHHIYAPEEIKPLYDSLHLSDYYVNAIHIQAFSSVEGDLKNNQRLQNARATSIIQGLQAYQSPEIPFEISTSENWESFYKDIEGTQFEYLSQLPKQKIKEELVDLKGSTEMESILSAHRKGLIRMSLKSRVLRSEPNQLIEAFGQAIENNRIENALYMQKFVFLEIKNNRLPEDFIRRLEIPKLSHYSPLITNQIIFEYENSIGRLEDHIIAFEELLDILPGNVQIQYNLAALKIRASNNISFASSRKEIWSLINALNGKIDETLVDRLKINYQILNTEFLNLTKEYREKNKSLRQIYAIYRKLDLSDIETLYLARFLSHYSQFKWAEEIVSKRVYDDSVDPQLVDYYLRLTLADARNLKDSRYMRLLKKTIDQNSEVFCNLFLPIEQGGYTFQLLEDPKLADLYCSNCESIGDDL